MAKKKNTEFGLNTLKDIEDKRDFPMKAILKSVRFSDTLDLRPLMQPVRNQGVRGACVAFATCAVKEYQENLERPKSKIKLDLSEEWIYRQIRVEGGGAYARDGFKILNHQGVPREQYLPYVNIEDHRDNLVLEFETRRKELNANMSAKHYKAESYARIATVDGMCESMFVNGACKLGVQWRDAWFHPREFKNGVPVLRAGQGRPAGGHDTAYVGYDYPNRMLLGRNSWGTDWCGGYFWITFDAAYSAFMDAWSSVDITKSAVKKSVLKELKSSL